MKVLLRSSSQRPVKIFPRLAALGTAEKGLQDVEMSFETMEKVSRPKILGMVYLDRLSPDNTLYFFLMFSSLAAAAGNRGQSNYCAANMFMVETAMERRHQGLAASVLHLGAVLGVGFVMRELDETVLPTIYRAGSMWMEETGFDQCIAEAILAGRPRAGPIRKSSQACAWLMPMMQNQYP
ncbi:hypothetical protein J3458_019648 [Metarhizium acridum]|nr:hypothetical protein J3458_019648 [Metarhizium acridum]